jgi:hypothetical protein
MDRTIGEKKVGRTHQGGKQDSRRAQPSVRSRRNPPVISRSEIGLTAAAVDQRPLPRRRVDVSLPASGAEIRLPAVPAIGNKWRVVSGLLTVSLSLGLFFLTQAGMFRIDTIEMQGLERFTEGEIAQAINIRGASVFFVSPERIKEDLRLTYPALSEVEVEVGWPAKVAISLVERVPVLAWNWEGHVRWVDKNGVAFEPLDLGLDVVQVNSTELPPTVADRFVDPRIVDTVSALAPYIPEGVNMIYDSVHGLGWSDPRGWVVYFGFNDEDTEKKIKVYQALVEYLQGKRITPKVINVEFLASPYFRMDK